jgi:hypothetical protein
VTSPLNYVEEELNEDPPFGKELGSSFSWNDTFGGYEAGKVFTYPDPVYRDYHEMLDTDGKAANIEQLLTFPIISAPWEVEAPLNPDGTTVTGGKGDEIRQFIMEAFTDLPHQGGPRTTMEQLVSQMTMAFTDKLTLFAKSFKEKDGKAVYDKVAWRPLETCELAYDAKTSDLRGFYQTPVTFSPNPTLYPQGNRIWIPMERAFIYIHGTWRDPVHGISSMRVPYWCFITKRKLRWLWYQFLDQNYLPKTIVRNPDDRQAVSDARKVATLRSKGVVGLRADTEVTPFESGGHGAAGYMEAIRFLDSEMSGSIMAGFADLTSQAAEGKGSYALAESQAKLFLRARRMVATDMANQITNKLVADLVRYNYGRKAPCPRFKFGPLSEQNELAVLDMFKSVASTGANVDPTFYDELQARVATLLELDQGKVRQSMSEGTDSPGSLQEMATKVGVATQMVAGAQAAGQIPPSPVGPPPGGAGGAGASAPRSGASKAKTAAKSSAKSSRPRAKAQTGSQSVVSSAAAAKKRTQTKKKTKPK